jgi:hypothetical protein
LRLAIFIMDDCHQELTQQLAVESIKSPQKPASSATSLSRVFGESNQEKKMEYTQQNDQTPIYESNFRAEDGVPTSRMSALYEGVVIPLASLFAIFLFMVGAMVITH